MFYLVKMKSLPLWSAKALFHTRAWVVCFKKYFEFLYIIYIIILKHYLYIYLYILYLHSPHPPRHCFILDWERTSEDWSALHRLLCAALNAIWRGLGYCWVVFKSIDKYLHPEMPLEHGSMCRPQSWLSQLQYKVALWSILSIGFSQRYRARYVNKLHLSQVGLQKHS